MGKFGQVQANYDICALKKFWGSANDIEKEEETSREVQMAKKWKQKLSGEKKKKEEEKVGSRIRRRLSAN